MIICPACRSENNIGPLQTYREFGIDYDYTRYSCKDCGVEFWTPLVMPQASYYEQDDFGYDQFHTSGSSTIRWWHKTFMEKFPGFEIKGKILDIGCADGRLLKKVKEYGWDIYGIDLDKKSVEAARINCSTDHIYHCYFDEFIKNNEPNSFDVITFFEVLEHQPDPNEFIQNVRKLLKPNGWIAGSVPNTSRYIVKNRFSPDNPPHHFTLWNKQNLKSYLNTKGFNASQIVNTRYEPILLDQIIRNRFVGRMNEFRSVEITNDTSRRDSIYKRYRFFRKLKQLLWTPLYSLIGLFEYPLLYVTKKSVSLYFHAMIDSEI
jgi:2-polyprenyl-3-methyl-5-hydroxy-6-metoxy-1,4-benzoquinol methylase